MRKIIIVVFVFVLTLTAVNCLPIHGEEAIYESVVRLHVVANSDSETDQTLKLAVRDAVLGEMSGILDGCSDRGDALTELASELENIQAKAEQTVADAGFDYPVTVSLGEEKYPTKSYEEICFPSGVYSSLQVNIGSSEGQNWWCVLFPELCLSGAKSAEEAFISVGLTSEQYKVITETDDPKYKIRFKFLDIIGEALG